MQECKRTGVQGGRRKEVQGGERLLVQECRKTEDQ